MTTFARFSEHTEPVRLLEAALREGPRMARVDRLEMEIVEPSAVSAESFDAVF